MNRLARYQTQHAETRTAMEAILAAAPESGDLTPEQTAAYDALNAKLAGLKASITREEDLIKAEAAAPAVSRVSGDGSRPVAHVGAPRSEADPRKGFASHREFCEAVLAHAGATSKAQIQDERLQPLAVADKDDKAAGGHLAFMLPVGFTPRGLSAAAGSDEQGAYSDPHGGFAVTTARLPGMLSVGFEGDPTAGRTMAVPMAAPSVEILARTDKNHSSSVSGGFTVARKAETAAAAASRGEMELITLKANSLFGLAYATEEILTDSPMSFAAIIAAGFQSQMSAHMLNEKIRGTGAGEFQGVLNSAAKIEVAKESGQAADTIVANNVIKMAARSWGFGDAIWLANHDTRPQLAVLNIPIGTSGVLLYQPSRGDGFPDMLWGRPVFYTEYASTVGDVGDLMLVNWSQYLEGTYQPLQSAESVHVRFLNHERAFKFWLRNAGAPWWRSALTPAKSSTTLSPIVTLAARA